MVYAELFHGDALARRAPVSDLKQLCDLLPPGIVSFDVATLLLHALICYDRRACQFRAVAIRIWFGKGVEGYATSGQIVTDSTGKSDDMENRGSSERQ
jgi:hypothetical protein